MDDKNLSLWIKSNFDFVPKDLHKYRKAITTRQYEVLEFFGDSILSFIVSEYLVINYAVDKPGWFTEVRAKLVEDKNLSLIARKINLASLVIIPNTSNRLQITDRVIADVLEAIIGAIYLDQGLDKSREIIIKLFELNKIHAPDSQEKYNNIKEQNIIGVENPISTLQELLAKYGISPPQYIDIEKKGPDNAPIFTIRANCIFRGKYLTADGTGGSRREAKRNAAHKLLVMVLKS
ncbi:dsRNA-specific ribonuclease [Nostoc sp. PCC 7524]|uniref:ribonuclease III family protein n=1 Tax=Nostoc sp. (strain ATCC 29411 / PCC 7524) TaxID=28072 RepID=UPI00029F3A9B|nr:ribonuclease III domain-containing protein [Nostoc sp. PCC 7524]AFY50294.1 dsRNA-specific ribonuclease [Nostoc sp. PCC 7524]